MRKIKQMLADAYEKLAENPGDSGDPAQFKDLASHYRTEAKNWKMPEEFVI